MHLVNIRMFKRVRDHRNGKMGFCNIKAGEARSIHRYGAFFNHQRRKFPGKLKSIDPTAQLLLSVGTNRGGIHMSLYNMAIQPAIHNHTPFNIDLSPGQPLAQVRFVEGFRDRCHKVPARLQRFYGKANPAMTHTLVNF